MQSGCTQHSIVQAENSISKAKLEWEAASVALVQTRHMQSCKDRMYCNLVRVRKYLNKKNNKKNPKQNDKN